MRTNVNIADKLKAYFQSTRDISFAFLFGSYARGKTFKESDVDIAIYLKEGYSFERMKEIWSDIEDLLGKDVDMLILNNATPLMGYEAIRGKAIAINDYKVYLDYMLRISQEAEDFGNFLLDMWRLKERFKGQRTTHEPIK